MAAKGRVYESVDDIGAYLRLYLENRRKTKFRRWRVKNIIIIFVHSIEKACSVWDVLYQ